MTMRKESTSGLPSLPLTFQANQQLLVSPLMDRLHVVLVLPFFPFCQTVLSIDFHLFYVILNCHH